MKIYNELYINGRWMKSNSDEMIEVENPSTREIIGRVPSSNETDVIIAVEYANKAFETWQYSPVSQRTELMNKLCHNLTEKIDLMAETIRDELGCGINYAKDIQVKPYIEDIKNYIRIIESYQFQEEFEGYTVVKEPTGVVGALTPWNFPLGQILKKIVPAILTGNTVVLKPSQQTPLVSYILAQAIHESGFPPGVFNLVTGKGGKVGDLIARHKNIAMISFTGSTQGGIEVAKIALDDVKKIALELGGKSPSIVLKGADLNLAVKKTLDKVYHNTGQVCSAYSRLLIPEEYKETIEKMVIEETKQYRFGNPRDPETIIGTLSSKKQFDKVTSYIQKGVQEGARLLMGDIPTDYTNGYYVGPTVFTDVDNNMTIARDEIFGPVLCIITYKDEEDAVKIANDTRYGLSGAVFGPEEDARKIARRIKTGTIVINEGMQTHRAPFGGYKHSGIGREGGIYGIEEFLEIKSMYM